MELVKFSHSPLKVSLLPLDNNLNALAVQTFIYIMRYMGDYPMDHQQVQVDCVYLILKVSGFLLNLRSKSFST